MSRSAKHPPPVPASWHVPDPCDQPGTEKAGARDRPRLRPRNNRQNWLLFDRRSYGSTEKILRRNRKTWTRMFSKVGRQLDKQAIVEGSCSSES
jgi:hypothetical protein